jgi:hypothetical protein
MPTNGQGQIGGSSQPQPRVPLPSSGAPNSGAAPSSPINDALKIFREWLLLDSDVPALAMLGTVAANMLPGDPVWLGLIAPSSSAKTEMLITLVNLPHVELVGTLSPAGLLSGTPRRQHAAGARGGLLQKIGAFGFLVLKDFGSVLSMRPDSKAEMLAALREIYDGHWTRIVGADGGKVLHWSGKIGLLFGCTRVIDSYHGFIGALGDRFLFCRLEPNKKQFHHAARHIGIKTAQMRRHLTKAVTDLFAVPLQTPQDITDEELNKLDKIVQLIVRLRGPVERDYHTRELLNVYGAEGPARLGLTLERLLAGLDSLGIERGAAFTVVETVAFDSVPPNRLRIYRHLQVIDPAWANTATVAKATQLTTVTARRALEELVAYGLVERGDQGQGTPTLWRLAQ